jgi:pimeloyl-ACP methyl ester carboxylesterase
MQSLLQAFVGLMCFSAIGLVQTTAYDFDGFVDLDSKISLAAKMKKGDPDAPVIVMLNGLTQDMDHWKTVVPFLDEKKATIVEIDLALQGRSLVKRVDEKSTWLRPILKPLVMFGGAWDQEPVLPVTSIEEQAKYVIEVLHKLNIDRPVVLLGLSYGGGLALQIAADFPSHVKKAILVAPYAFPLPDQDKALQQMVKFTKDNYPQWRHVSDDNLYDIILRGMVVTTYPSAEPEILKWRPPYQSFGASELVRGIRHMEYLKLFERLEVPLHLVVAGKDTYVPRDKLDEFWRNVPADLRGSFMEVQGVEHKVNESVGPFLAAWAWELASKTDYLAHPGQFLGVPEKGIATEIGGTRVIELEKATPCESWLTMAQPPKLPTDFQKGFMDRLFAAAMALVGQVPN